MRRPDSSASKQRRVDDFNHHYPIGTPIRYWTGIREGEGKSGETRSEATLLGGHTPVVWVTGHAACIALSHIEPIGIPVAENGVRRG